MACPSYPALSAMEEQLIALVLPVVKIVRLQCDSEEDSWGTLEAVLP